MSRKALSEVLARGWYEARHERAWELSGTMDREMYLTWAGFVVDGAKDFVAEWLLSTGSAATFLSEAWRKDMQP